MWELDIELSGLRSDFLVEIDFCGRRGSLYWTDEPKQPIL